MSTRATYSFSGQEYSPTTTLYIHHDGYPAGAARYFYDALNGDFLGGMAERMLRGVPRAEITEGHDVHGDSEYRYSVEGSGAGATVKAQTSGEYLAFDGTLAEFIDTHRDAGWWEDDEEPYSKFREVDGEWGKGWHNATTARRAIEESSAHGRSSSALGTLRIWAKQSVMTPQAANWQGVAGRVVELAEAFGFQDVLDEVAALEAREDAEEVQA